MSAKEFPAGARFDAAIVKALATNTAPLSNEAIERAVALELRLPAELLKQPHDANKGSRTEFSYRMAWAKTRLKGKGTIERAGTKSWQLVRQ